MKAYIIHNQDCEDRRDIVEHLQTSTGAEVVEAVWMKNPVLGCIYSHLKVAVKAKQDNEKKPYIVFEDDCDLLEDIDVILAHFQEADIVYFGYNDMGFDKYGMFPYFFGTHAMMISPKARDILLEHCLEHPGLPYDHIVSRLIKQFNLSVEFPDFEDKEKFAVQRKGLISTITGNRRS